MTSYVILKTDLITLWSGWRFSYMDCIQEQVLNITVFCDLNLFHVFTPAQHFISSCLCGSLFCTTWIRRRPFHRQFLDPGLKTNWKNQNQLVTCEAHMAVTMKSTVIWDVTSCNLIEDYDVSEECIALARKLATSFPPWPPRFHPRSGHIGFMGNETVLWQVFSKYFGFLCQFSFH
jgi:hypothetical protein